MLYGLTNWHKNCFSDISDKGDDYYKQDKLDGKGLTCKDSYFSMELNFYYFLVIER